MYRVGHAEVRLKADKAISVVFEPRYRFIRNRLGEARPLAIEEFNRSFSVSG